MTNLSEVRTIAALLCLTVSPALLAGPGSSANYSTASNTINAGGTRTTSTNYAHDFSLGEVVGVSGVALPAQAVRYGYIAQLYEVTGLQISPSLTGVDEGVDEGGTCQLRGSQMLDDLTTLAVPSGSIAWSVQSGPLSGVSSGGLAMAGLVYQDSVATAQGSYAGHTGTLNLTVLDTIADNFGAYAGDLMPDGWQVVYFGENGPNAGPGGNPDGDNFNNLLELAFGTDPTVNFSGMLQYSGTLAGGGVIASTGQPTTMFESVPNGIDFRALFVRRKDYVAAGLTYIPQFSADLFTWQNSADVPMVLADDGTYQIVSVPYPVFIAGKKARFFRITVSLEP